MDVDYLHPLPSSSNTRMAQQKIVRATFANPLRLQFPTWIIVPILRKGGPLFRHWAESQAEWAINGAGRAFPPGPPSGVAMQLGKRIRKDEKPIAKSI